MKIIKLLALFMVLCNIPGYMLAYFGPSLGSASSYLSSLLFVAYFVLVKKRHKPLLPFIYLGLLYFGISAFNYTHVDTDNFFIKELIRFMIVVICGAEVVQRTNQKEICFFLFIGAVTIILNAFVFPWAQIAAFGPTYGRFSGFYLNPNLAGFICLMGYAISFSIPKLSIRIVTQIVFTLAGILTFSRTFIIVWLFITFFAILKNKKNLLLPLAGLVLLTTIFTFSEKLTLNTERFSALKSFFGEEQIDTKTIKKDSRDETWALYYDMILEKPLLGNGYLKLSKKYKDLQGVHNAFLMILGEAGIFPFLLFIGIYAYLLVKSFMHFKTRPELFYISLMFALSLMTGHGYFSNFQTVFLSMFIFVELHKLSKERAKRDISDEPVLVR